MENFLKKNFKPLLAGIIFLGMYAPTFIWMWDRWFAKDSYYSHGILIPFVSIYLIWQKKDELANVPLRSSPWAIPVLIIGILIHLSSSITRIYFSSGVSMWVVLIGLILYFYGDQVLRKIWFPIFFLVFMLPLPLKAIRDISFTMKTFAAEIATYWLNKIGILAIRDGSWIKMRGAHVIVDDVCSGLRSLISLTALGSIFAYWLPAKLWKRIVLCLSTIPIAIITNVCRVMFLSVVSEVWGPQYAVGFIHDLSGYMIFALAFILLYSVGRLLE